MPTELIDHLLRTGNALIRAKPDVGKFDELFWYLQERLSELSELEQTAGAAVRAHGAIARSNIAAAAMEMLEILTLENQLAPPYSAFALLRSLLAIPEIDSETVRRTSAWTMALMIEVLEPGTGNNKIARQIGVNASTVSRWRRSEKYCVELEKMKSQARDPRWKVVLQKALSYMRHERKNFNK